MAHSTPFVLASVFSFAVGLMIVACSSSESPATPPVEAGTDTAAPADAAASDGALVCGPQLVPGFSAKFHPAAGLHQGKCTSAEIETIIDVCIRNGEGFEEAKCAAARAAAQDCGTCLFSSLDRSPSAPILLYPGFYDRNMAGCVGLFTGDSSATSCAAKVATAFQCNLASCQPSCPLTKNEDFVALNACGDAASASDAHCKAAADASNGCVAALPADVRAVCFEDISNNKILTVLGHFAQLFCGSSPDGGADAGDGG